ncbi:R3H domain-containing protein 2-like [Sinocyclocheilus anshuiensis]|uniref:R3H domain-containing protein 2-like n=1 Tax=Sinocyclocheilus anshuiensis TaxID=1608454 RepID=UPI0007B805E3|nr:PREDICTED: R3H domain-containing protein 2-like [Sinocyclocheilus anshuiensis]
MSVVFTPDGTEEGDGSLSTDASAGIHGKSSPSAPAKDTNADSTEPDDNLSQDAQRRCQNHGHTRKRAKSNAKLKLVRSLAVCEESSGPFSTDCPLESQDVIQLHISCPSDKEEEKSSKDEYENEEREKKDKTPRKMLSRDSSQEYTDSTGIDVHEFLVNTLKNNPRDRMMLLKLEQDILDFINDENNQYKKFPQMTSYHRMLLHRVAAYFGMDHNVDQTGKAVIINKTSNTRIPEQRFSEHIKDERNMDFQKKFILKRDDASMDKDDNQIRVPLQDGRRSKSIEEREEEYQRVRDRIFARESSQNGYIIDNRGNRESSSRASSSRQSSTDSDMKSLEPRPWSSTDSDSSNRTLRPPVTKASSFSGISILTRGDSLGSARGSRTGLPTVTLDVCTPAQPLQQSRGLLPCPPNCPSGAPQTPSQPAPPPLLPTPTLTHTHSHTHTHTQHAISAHNHMLPQPSAQAVSYSNPSCPQVILPVSPSQQYNMGDELTPGFGQMSLSRQSSSEAPEPPSLYQPPPAVLSQHPPPQPSYILPPPPSGYQPAAPHPHPPPPPPPPTQPILQTAPPLSLSLSLIQVQYYSTGGQYPNSGQQFRSISHQVSYPTQRSQPLPPPAQPSAPLQPMMTNQQPAYQGMMGVQQPQSASMMNTQRTAMNGQMPGMMVQYPPMPSYQVPVANESQSVVQQQYQQPVMVPASQSVQAAMPTAAPMPVYYSVLTPTQQNSTSPSVGYLQPPSSDQYQMTQSASPCSPQPMQQQYSGVPPPGPGVMVMQLSVPNGPQPTQNPPLVQWNPCKYYSMEQRPSNPEPQVTALGKTKFEFFKSFSMCSKERSENLSCATEDRSQILLITEQLISDVAEPMGSLLYVCVCVSADGRYSLLGQPLQYSLCPPPIMHNHNQSSYSSHQSQGVMKHGARGKRQTLKSASTDLGTTDVVVSRVLEVTDLPEGISRPEAEKLFNQLSLCGAKIQWLKDPQCPRGHGGGRGDARDPANLYTVVAVFPNTMAAQSASFKLNNSGGSLFKLRATKKNYDLRVLERASSQ